MRTSNKIYNFRQVDTAVNTLMDKGYEIIMIPGVLVDDYICLAPSDHQYNFYFYEVYLNSWNSGLKMQRFSGKLTGQLKTRFLDSLNGQEEDFKEFILDEYANAII